MTSSADPGEATPTAHRMANALVELGITHVVTVPDNTSAVLLEALQGGAQTSRVRLVFATGEGEAVALAAGLWLGGALPAVLIQNTGLLESGDALRGTLSRMGAPVLLLITCRGYQKAREAGVDPRMGIEDRSMLVRPDLDSVAHMTEATLRAWGVPHHSIRDPDELSSLSHAFNQAVQDERPVAVLLDTAFR